MFWFTQRLVDITLQYSVFLLFDFLPFTRLPSLFSSLAHVPFPNHCPQRAVLRGTVRTPHGAWGNPLQTEVGLFVPLEEGLRNAGLCDVEKM